MSGYSVKEQENNDWISVKERLPEEGEDVLFYVLDAKLVDFGWLDDESCFVGTNFGFDLQDVTHWQPLPQPPEIF